VPFEGQLNENVWFAPYPGARVDGATELCLDVVDQVLATGEVGAVVMEPVLGRGGVALPHEGALREVAVRAHASGALVIADEIYTGLGRTGARFRSVADGVDADMVCLGKALGGGLAASACLMRDAVARSWGDCVGEAIHTSTFLGNPLACAAAMASLDVLEHEATRGEIARAAETLARVLHRVASRPGGSVRTVTCAGLLAGVTLEGGLPRVLATVRAMLERGYIVLPGGVAGDGLTLTPPCCVTDAQLEAFGDALIEVTTSAPLRS
jgi:4-aminobutyrate aminotransferase/(S)-3-amino-2-methylpropionate transaminase